MPSAHVHDISLCRITTQHSPAHSDGGDTAASSDPHLKHLDLLHGLLDLHIPVPFRNSHSCYIPRINVAQVRCAAICNSLLVGYFRTRRGHEGGELECKLPW